MKTTWIEIVCDGCGCADHYKPGNVDSQARENGWVITRKGKHFCSKECHLSHSSNARLPTVNRKQGA